MPIVDDRGRVAGRVNLIDALVAVFLLVLVPFGYGAYLLFRTPKPKLVGIAPTTVYQGPNLRIGISGLNLRPFMRVSFDTIQGRTFLIGSTKFAAIDLPDLAPGTYDVVLYDYMQEVDRLPKALTVLPLAPQPEAEMEVAGSFVYVPGTAPIAVGEKFPPKGEPIAEVISVGQPMAAEMRIRSGDVAVGVPLPGYREVPATLRVKCSVGANPDGTLHCSVQGPQALAIVAPDSNLTLPGPNGWVNFQIAEAHTTVKLPAARARVTFIVTPALLTRIKVGDTDRGPGANASGSGARIVSLDGVAAASASAVAHGPIMAGDARALTATLQVPIQQAAGGWSYKREPFKIGGPFTFETAEYVVHGEIADMTLPPPATGVSPAR
jgi:hypothetical protein